MKKWVKKFTIAGHEVLPGKSTNLRLPISKTYTGSPISIPVRVMRAKKAGPTITVCAALHGDEVNGTSIIHDIMYKKGICLTRGTLVLIPVVNVFGFETGERYLPDRRDLNRSFPGSAKGSLAARYAHALMSEIINHSDYCIDLHAAATGRTNYPNVRADTSKKEIKNLAMAFGTTLVVCNKGPDGSLRNEATKVGCHTIILEAGEANKMEPSVLNIGMRGIENILKLLNMLTGVPDKPSYQVVLKKNLWVRSEASGILRFHVAPGDIVKAGQPVASTVSIFGRQESMLFAPSDGVVIGMATLPTVKPGEPVCHIGIPSKKWSTFQKGLMDSSDTLISKAKRDLATNLITYKK